jgi:hypothetical protein
MKKYLECSRSPWYSLWIVLPLWLAYLALNAAVNFGQKRQILNGADALLRAGLSLVGVQGQLAGMAILAVIIFVWVYRKDAAHRKQGLYPGYFLGMLAESAVYAFLFGGVIVRAMQLLMPRFLMNLQTGGISAQSVGLQFMGSLGAGVYEELLFRVLIMGGLTLLGVRLMKMKPGAAFFGAMLISSLIFSGFHYIGPLRDTFTVASFTFRFLAGILLAVIYRTRGFGVAAYTHAFYDLLLVMQGFVGMR